MNTTYAPFVELTRKQLERVEGATFPDIQATVTLTVMNSGLWDFDDPEHRWGLDAAFRRFHRDFSRSVSRPCAWEGELAPRVYGFVEAFDGEIFVTARVGRDEWMSYGTFDHVLDMALSAHLIQDDTDCEVAEIDPAVPIISGETAYFFPSFFSENPAVAAEVFEAADEEVGRANLEDFITAP